MSIYRSHGIGVVALGLLPVVATAQTTTTTSTEDPLRQVWVDFDEDGLSDLYSIATGREDVLLKNLGDGGFANATLEAGLGGIASVSARTADYDQDDHTDILLITTEGGLRLFQATGSAFQEVTADAGLSGALAAVRAEWIDYDKDGWEDLWLENAAGQPTFFHNEGGLSFERIVLGLPAAASMPSAVTTAVQTPAAQQGPSAGAGKESGGSNVKSGKVARFDDVPTTPGRRRIPPDVSLAGNEQLLTSSSGAFQGAVTPLALLCTQRLRDQSGGCLLADSVPTLGRLHPMSVNLNVDSATGNVGSGTTAPGFDLHVVGDVKGESNAVPTTNGYLGVQGATPFDAVATASWSGFELGVVGISTGPSISDNWGVMGHSNNAGVRGEYSGAPTTDYGELGRAGVGVTGSGATAGEFHGDVSLVNSAALTTMDIDESNVGGSSITMVDDLGNLTFFLDSDWGLTGASRLELFDGGLGGIGVDLDAGLSDDGGTVKVSNSLGAVTIELDGENFTGGGIEMFADDGIETIDLDSDSGGGAAAFFRNTNGSTRVTIDGDDTSAGGGGTILAAAADGSSTVFIDGESTNSGGLVSVRNDVSQATVELIGDTGNQAGTIAMWDRTLASNSAVINARDSAGTGADIVLMNQSGNVGFDLDAGGASAAIMFLRETDGSSAMEFVTDDLTLRNSAGTATVNWDRQTGTKSAVVDTKTYGQRMLYVMESPEVWFEDFGSGQLSNGSAVVHLDPMFLETATVDDANPLKVFVTLNGNSTGVYVEKGFDHFVVHELSGGTGNAAFDYRVVAKRRGLEDHRLERFEEPVFGGDVAPATVTPLAPHDAVDGELNEVEYAPKAPEPQKASASSNSSTESVNRLKSAAIPVGEKG